MSFQRPERMVMNPLLPDCITIGARWNVPPFRAGRKLKLSGPAPAGRSLPTTSAMVASTSVKLIV